MVVTDEEVGHEKDDFGENGVYTNPKMCFSLRDVNQMSTLNYPSKPPRLLTLNYHRRGFLVNFVLFGFYLSFIVVPVVGSKF